MAKKTDMNQERAINAIKKDPDLAARFVAAFLAPMVPKAIASSADVVALFRPVISAETESLYIVALSRRNEIVGTITLTTGNSAHTIVDSAQILRWALTRERSVQALVMAHNHPSGDPTPSLADIEVTAKVAQACQTVGLDLLDHVILVLNGGCRSLREEGLMPILVKTNGIMTGGR